MNYPPYKIKITIIIASLQFAVLFIVAWILDPSNNPYNFMAGIIASLSSSLLFALYPIYKQIELSNAMLSNPYHNYPFYEMGKLSSQTIIDCLTIMAVSTGYVISYFVRIGL